jgi:hypothetical protein
MAENDSTIELPTEGGTDTTENRDELDLRRSVRKQQVMDHKAVDSTNYRPETRTSSKTKHNVSKDPEKLISGESGHYIDGSLEQSASGRNDPEKLDLSGSEHDKDKSPMKLNTGKTVLSIFYVYL